MNQFIATLPFFISFITGIQHLLCVRLCSKCLTIIDSIIPYNKPITCLAGVL